LSAPRFPRENWDMWGFIVDGVSLVLLSVAVLLILLILIQRGKGGGFIGALDGSIPFGSRARHQFTRWTIYSALALLYLTMFLVKMIQMGPWFLGRLGR